MPRRDLCQSQGQINFPGFDFRTENRPSYEYSMLKS